MIPLLNNALLPYILVAFLASLAGIGLLILGVLRSRQSSDSIRQRMQIFINDRVQSGSFKELVYRLTPRELTGSFYNRAIQPLLKRIVDFLGRFAPYNSMVKIDFDLRIAGNPYGLHARGYYAFRVMLLFFGIGLAFLINLRTGFVDTRIILVGALVIFAALATPRAWLNSRIRQRKEELSLNLPDLLDMLSVCVTAGLSFDQGLKRICDDWPTALTDEFRQVLQEMEMGISRADALRNLKARVEVDSLSSFISILIQSENTGMSYADVLQNQAIQLRVFRQLRAKEKANSLSAKLIIPIVIFIFPALLAVIIAPIIPILLGLFA
jgi:tight adherence protein C